MRVPIDSHAFIDLDAPTLPAYEVRCHGAARWLAWCKHCNKWHQHGPGEGHRIAHCEMVTSLYQAGGYNLAFAGSFDALAQLPHG